MNSSELFEKAASLIKKEIVINKELVGVNFSSFFGDVINLVANLFFAIEVETEKHGKENFQFPILKSGLEYRLNRFMFALTEIASRFQEKPRFQELIKAIGALGLINCSDCYEERGKLEMFAEELMTVQEDAEINDRTFKCFLMIIGNREKAKEG
jgi:hypothetical protein